MTDPFDLNPTFLENAISDVELNEFDEFNANVDFDKFIVLSKKELANFCRMVEPLTKASIDDYGKSVFIKCIDDSNVEIRYFNNPYVLTLRVDNKSGKQISSCAVSFNTFKKLITSAFASIILVEQDNEIYISLCESLLYLETKPLKEELYNLDKHVTEHVLDREISCFNFKKLSSIFSCTERASEKVVVVKDNNCIFNTGIFVARSKSPFLDNVNCVLYKQSVDILGIISEISKVSVKYSLADNILYVSCDDVFYCELPIGSEEKINDFLSPATNNLLSFDANISIINDNLLRLISIVQSLDYLSDIVTIEFTKKDMNFKISTNNQSKTSVYTFPFVEGTAEVEGEMKLTTSVLKIFLQIVGSDVSYNFNSTGLCIKNEFGKFLLRKS